MVKYCLLFFCSLIFCLNGAESEVDLKEIIAAHKEALQSSDQKSPIYYELALCYYRDQEIDRAFLCFLQALESAELKKPITISDDESHIYQKVLEEYLTGDSIRQARSILERYEKVASEHPHYFHIKLLLAIAFANLGQYEKFFELFYKLYPLMHHSFLADKTQATLFLKLSQRVSSLELKTSYQERAKLLLLRAKEKYPQDGSLYKTLIFLAKDEKNQEAIRSLLSKMILHQAKYARSDVFSYVNETIILKEYTLAQTIIDQARTHYGYSRSIEEAQEFLQRVKSKE